MEQINKLKEQNVALKKQLSDLRKKKELSRFIIANEILEQFGLCIYCGNNISQFVSKKDSDVADICKDCFQDL